MSTLSHKLSHIRNTFVRQHSENYCGLACLTSIVRYHGGRALQESLAGVSGTTFEGTTMLGLYQTAQKMGMDAEGFEADAACLKEISAPVILHILKEERLEHYVVCYGYSEGKFLIGDPGIGLTDYSQEELESVWKTKTLLVLSPGIGFITREKETYAKLKWVKTLVNEDVPVLSTAAFLGVLLSILGLSIAFFSQKLIDQILPEKDTAKLVGGLCLLLLVLLAKGLLSYVRGIFLIRQGRDFNNRVVGYFFEKLMYLPKSFFDSITTGDMVSRLNDTSRMRQTIIKFTSGILIDLLVFITTISYIFFLSPSTGLLSLSAIPVFGLIAWHYNGKIIAAQRTVLQSSASTQSKYIDAIQRIEVIKTANTEQKHTKLIKTVYSYLQNQIYQLGLLGNKIGLVTQTFSTLILSGTLAWASFLVLNGNLLVGQMMAILSLIGNLIGAVSNISMANIDFQEARVAFVRMYEFAASEKEYEKDQTSTIDQSLSFDKLEIRNLNFRYPGKGLLLNDLNLTIGKGKIITIFGEVGCGKSTLISILQRFYPIESGEIVVDGIIWDKLDNFQWRNHIAVVSQQVKLFNQTIIENISLSRSAKEMEKVVAFCKEIGLHDFIIGFQQAYATVVNENGLNLSGGQQQLIGLARALYQRPQLLLLDEATAAMDRKTEQLVLEILNKLKHDMAIVIVTHRVQISRRTDYIYLIENRTSEIHGTHDELIQSDNIYKDSFEEIQIS